MAFYFKTDGPGHFSVSNPSSNIAPTNGVSVYIAGSPGSRYFTHQNDSRLEVYFDGVLHRRFEVDFQTDDDGEFVNMGDLNIGSSTNGNTLIFTLEPVKIPNDATNMELKARVYNGEYLSYEQTFTFNSPPEISGSDSDLGVKNSAFTVDFSIDDANSTDILSVTGYLNDEIFYEDNNVERNKNYMLEITNALLSNLELGGRNEIVIEVSDTKATTRRIYSFTKEIDLDTYCEYSTEPIIVASRPNCIIVGQSLSCDGGVNTKVYVTCNALDNSPRWEDMTDAYLKGSAHYFTNKVCASDKYAIALRFVNAKENADSVINVTGFGFVTDVTVIGDDGLPRQLPGFVTDYVSGSECTIKWVNPEKNFTANIIVRDKNRMPLTETDGELVGDGDFNSMGGELWSFQEDYFNPETYWSMIENKQYDYWTNVALNKPNSAFCVDGDTYVYRKFPYGDNGIQRQQYNGILAIACRGTKYPYPENSITIDKAYSAEHGSIDIPVIGHIPGNMVNFKCERGEGRAVIATGEFIEDNAVIRVSAVRPGFSELIAYTGALSQETRATIRVCDRLYLRINTFPYLAIGGERGYVSYKVTNSLGEDLTDKCLLHYSSETKQIHDDFTVNILGGGSAEIIYNKDATSKINLSQYHFWAEIDGKNYEKESKIYLRSYGIEV